MALRVSVILLAVLALLWGAGLVWFVSDLDQPSPDPNTPVDAIVVLTGGSLRIDAGMQLLVSHRGQRLFVSGVHPGIDIADLLRQGGGTPAWVRCCIVLGHASSNTIGNAVETAAWLQSQGYHSIRLVTANYHMKRSLLEFRRVLPGDIRIIPNPVFPEATRPGPWWLWRGTAHVIIVEYTKYLGALAREVLLSWIPGLAPVLVPSG